MNSKTKIAQRGFTLIELMFVLAIIALLASLAVPALKSTSMDAKAPEIGKVVQFVINKTRSARLAGDTWATATDQELGKLLNADGRVTITGSGASVAVQHNLGDQGVLHFAPGTITSSNDAGQITATNVNESACPSLANTLSRYVDVMTVNGTTVKSNGGNYLGSAAQNACTSGDTNTVIFLYH